MRAVLVCAAAMLLLAWMQAAAASSCDLTPESKERIRAWWLGRSSAASLKDVQISVACDVGGLAGGALGAVAGGVGGLALGSSLAAAAAAGLCYALGGSDASCRDISAHFAELGGVVGVTLGGSAGAEYGAQAGSEFAVGAVRLFHAILGDDGTSTDEDENDEQRQGESSGQWRDRTEQKATWESCRKLFNLPRCDKKLARKAYQDLSLKWHPDKNKSDDAHQRMVEVNVCKEIIWLKCNF